MNAKTVTRWSAIVRWFILGLIVSHGPAGVSAASEEIIDLSRRTVTLERSGDTAGALLVAQKSLALAEATLGPEHPTVAIYLEQVGVLHRKLGQGTQAESQLRRALAIREARLGPDHAAVATTLIQLARLYQGEGRQAEAETHLQRALEIRERVQGPTHPTVATLLRHYAGLLRDLNRMNEASQMEARARAIEHNNPAP